jgi:hypothetical protein
MKPLLNFVRPTWNKALLLVLFALLTPVPFLIREPASQISNDYFLWKYRIYDSLFVLFVGNHASGFDTFLGVVEAYFFHNLLGFPLLLICYVAACAASFCLKSRCLSIPPSPPKTS